MIDFKLYECGGTVDKGDSFSCDLDPISVCG